MASGNGTYTGLGQNLGNDFESIAKYLTGKMDEQIVHEALTAGLGADPDLVQATSSAGTVKLGTIEATGLGNYDKVLGYPAGGMSLTFQEYTLRYDRAISATVDRRDSQITGGIAQAATGLAWTMKHKVIPEIDATRMATIFEKLAAENATNQNVVAGAKPTAANVIGKITSAINSVRKTTGYDSGLKVFVNAELMDVIDQTSEVQKSIDVSGARGIDFTVPRIKGQEIVFVPDERMKTTVTLKDGFTGALTDSTDLKSIDATKFGYVPGAKSIWFMVLAPGVANAVTAIENTKIIPAATNQKFDGDTYMYRIYHDLIVPKNQAEAAYLSVETGALGA